MLIKVYLNSVLYFFRGRLGILFEMFCSVVSCGYIKLEIEINQFPPMHGHVVSSLVAIS